MRRWKDILDSLDTPGGHIFILVFLALWASVAGLIFAFGGLNEYAKGCGEFIKLTLIPTLFTVFRGKDKANGHGAGELTRATDKPDKKEE